MNDPQLKRNLGLVIVAALLAVSVGCGGQSPTLRPRNVTPNIKGNLSSALRGTIQSVARLDGIYPSRISGIGFVVGLNGTGGLPLNEEIVATVERMMLLRGVGKTGAYEGTRLAEKSPGELLKDRNTAVVIVDAAVPPGALAGDTFDVYVRAINATSLEGGQLWTSDLHVGPPTVIGQPQSRIVADATGPVFINPFTDPDIQSVGVSQTIGRVLGGGMMKDDLRIEIILHRVSHARARIITSAINSSFPLGPLDNGQIARGRDSRLVVVKIPRRFANRRSEFTQLLRYTVLDQTYPELYARRFVKALRESRGSGADQFGWALEALGERALPFIRELYDFAEAAPRLRALKTGAHLGDPLAADPLIWIANNGEPSIRSEAIRLLSYIDTGPRVDIALIDLLDDPSITTRIAAYETLTERGIKRRRDQIEAYDRNRPGGQSARLSLSAIDTLSRLSVPEGTILGVSRKLASGKFFLDRVPVGRGLIYITQQDEPRLALFGKDLGFQSTFVAGLWSDRFMLARDVPEGPIRLYYRDQKTQRVTTIEDVPTDIETFIEMLVHHTTPEDPRIGLNFTYSQVIGALYELNKAGVINAAFTTESDRLRAEVVGASDAGPIRLRPETPDEETPVIIRGYEDPSQELTPRQDDEPSSLLVPLGPAKGENTEDESP